MTESKTPEDKPLTEEEKEALKAEINRKWILGVTTGAAIHNWERASLGNEDDPNRTVPSTRTQRQFLADMPDFLASVATVSDKEKKVGKRARTLAEYNAEVEENVEGNAENAVWYDQVEFFKEVEECVKNKEKRNWFIRFIKWFFVKRLPKEVRKMGNSEKLLEILRGINDLYTQIDRINGEIYARRLVLEQSETQLEQSTDEEEKAKIREDINEQRETIHQAIERRAGIFEKRTNPKEILTNEAMQAIRQALKEESAKINQKFGVRISRLIRERQVLATQATQYENTNPTHFEKKLKLREQMEKIEIELNKIKKELIDYKSERPIFLFERVLGVQSIPIIYRYGQHSSIFQDQE